MSKTSDPLAVYHHPHFLEMKVENTYTRHFRFRPFAGSEQKPLCPQEAYRDLSVTRDQLTQLEAEYSRARMEWAAARFRASLAPHLPDLKEKWDLFSTSLDEMESSFAKNSASDKTWEERLLDLAEVHKEVENLAREWDISAYPIAVQYREYQDDTERDGPESLTSLLYRFYGLNIPSFAVGAPEEYENDHLRYTGNSVSAATPVVQYVREQVKYHRRVIEHVPSFKKDSPG